MALSSNDIKSMQSWYGTKADGIWGSGSTKAADGRSEIKAWSFYNQQKGSYNSYTDYVSRNASGSTVRSDTGTGSYGGTQSSATGNGINSNTIKEMQKWYGTGADGIWGKNSTAAAGGKNVNDAYTEWSNSRRYYGSYADYQNAQRNNAFSGGGTQSSGTGSAGSSGSSGSSGSMSTPSGSYASDDYGYSGGSYDYTGPMSYSDYIQRVGGDDYQAAVQRAIEAQVQAATDQYNSQIKDAGQDYEEAARRAYVSKMMSQRNMDQELAANGIYGGMADSQRIATETNYENDLTDLTTQYQSTIADLQQAITSAKLAGDAQAAESMASYLSQVQAQYASYLQNERGIQAEIDMFNRQLTAQQAQAAQSYSSGGSGYSSGGGGYDNGGLTAAQIMEMQRALGVTADGKWGSQSMAAADGMSAQEAWQAYQQASGSKSSITPGILGRIAGGATMSALRQSRL